MRQGELRRRVRAAGWSKAVIAGCHPASLVTHFLVGLFCFYLGVAAGGGLSGHSLPDPSKASLPLCDCSSQKQDKAAVAAAPQDKVDSNARVLDVSHLPPLFPRSMSQLVQGAVRIGRKDFASHLNLGIPIDQPVPGNQEVLVLYTNLSMVPDDDLQVTSTTPSLLPIHSARNAFAKCTTVKVILQQQAQPDVCIAIMGQYESFHILKYMRIPPNPIFRRTIKSIVNLKLPLRFVPRSQQNSGRLTNLPHKMITQQYWTILTDYLTKFNATSTRLAPLAKEAASKNGAIVVMVCNHGQSELLFNFVCSARSRGIDLSSILLFATDASTVELAHELDIHVFDVQDAFGEMPKEAAMKYGDSTFTGMMMAKVYCVHLINNMGYNLLFQDVDIIWRRNPLDFFKNQRESGNFDIYFQDDGARSVRYTPYSPNSGFYYVRHNERTENFFSVFVRMGDLIQASGSHQSALNAILSEHVSYRGLRVKVFGKDDAVNLFPGGFHYHKRPTYMKRLMEKKASPYIFHMSWTTNKDNKRLFFQQMGEWFVKSECENKPLSEIRKEGSSVASQCCSMEPLVSCHYRDKPSIIPCKDKPPIDAGKRSFW